MTIYRAEANKGRGKGKLVERERDREGERRRRKANEICKTGRPWRRLNVEEEKRRLGSLMGI